MFGNQIAAFPMPGSFGQTGTGGGFFSNRVPTPGASPIGGLVGDLMSTLNKGGNDTKLRDINWALRRFPELSYHISAIATFVSFANILPWVKRELFGPAGINVSLAPKLTPDQATAMIVGQAVEKLKEAGVSNTLPTLHKVLEAAASKSASFDKEEALAIRALLGELVEYNSLHFMMYNMAISLLCYSVVVLDYSEDYSVISAYSPNDLKFEDEKGGARASQSGNIGSAQQMEVSKLRVQATGEPLSSRAHAIVVGSGDIEESIVGKVVHYLRIVDVLETAMTVERMTKSVSFLVWLVGVDGLPGEQVTDYISAYRGIVMSRLKAGINDKNLVSAEISKSLTQTHLFVPNFKESPSDVKALSLNYRPLLDDINYWWKKIFMAMGIPPYYSISSDKSSATVSNDVSSFHESVFGSRVRMHQTVLENTLLNWFRLFLGNLITYDTLNKYRMSVSLPRFVSGGEEGRTEYMKRINQFASAYSTLGVAGMPLKPEFAVGLMFPNSDPNDVIDFRVRNANLEATMGIAPADGSTPQDMTPEDVNSMMDTMIQGEMKNEPATVGAPTPQLFNPEPTPAEE